MDIRIHIVDTAERFYQLATEYGRALNARRRNHNEHVPPAIFATSQEAAAFLSDLLGIEEPEPAVPLKTVVIDTADYDLEEFGENVVDDDEDELEDPEVEARRDELEAMSNDDLSGILAALGEPGSGNKAALVNRILEHEAAGDEEE